MASGKDVVLGDVRYLVTHGRDTLGDGKLPGLMVQYTRRR